MFIIFVSAWVGKDNVYMTSAYKPNPHQADENLCISLYTLYSESRFHLLHSKDLFDRFVAVSLGPTVHVL